MARVKSGPYRRRRHQRRIAYNSGYTGTRNHLFRRANEAFLKSQWYAYNDRRIVNATCAKLVDHSIYKCPAPAEWKLTYSR